MAYKIIMIDSNGPRREGVAAAAITPGDLIEDTTTARQVQKHSTRGGNAVPIKFATEDSLQGNDIDDNYSTSNRVQYVVPQRGDRIYARYPENVGWSPAIGDLVMSNGDGKVAEFQSYEDSSGLGETNPSNSIIGRVFEAGSSGRVGIEIA